MKTKQMATVTVAGTPHQVEYDTLEGLVSGIYDYQNDVLHEMGDADVILADGREFKWLASQACNCFAKGWISKTELARRLLNRAARLKELLDVEKSLQKTHVVAENNLLEALNDFCNSLFATGRKADRITIEYHDARSNSQTVFEYVKFFNDARAKMNKEEGGQS
jgi:hypothetical protein